MGGGALVVLGDALLDVDVDGQVHRSTPDAGVPVLDVTGETARPGGAALAAALLAGGDPAVTLVTALADDGKADRLRGLLAPALDLLAGQATGGTPVKCRWLRDGRPLLRTDSGTGRPAPGLGAAGAALPELLGAAGAVLVSDYGRGVAADPAVRAALAGALARGTPVVWDPHPKGPAPVAGVAVSTPNLAEARRAAGLPEGGPAASGAVLLDRWSCAAVAVTIGAAGAVLVRPDRGPLAVPAPEVTGGDPCGAGDAFAGALALRLAAGSDLPAAVDAATTAAARFVGDGGAAAVRWTGRAWRQPAPVLP